MIVKKIKPKLADGKMPGRARYVRDLTDYMAAPDQGEKLLFLGGVGFHSDDFATRQVEMMSVAHGAVRSPQPVQHWVLSWHDGEQPTPEQCEEAVSILLKEMGLTGHQALFALHQNTENIHLHIAINRVHPETELVIKVNDGKDFDPAHRAIALIEHRQGWQSEPKALFRVLEDGQVVAADRGKKPKGPARQARDMEARTGERSGQRIAAEELAEIIKASSSWAELHTKLGERGARFKKEGSGAVILIGETFVKASSAGRECSMPALKKRLGEFQPADAAVSIVERKPEPIRPDAKGWDDYIGARKDHYARKAREQAEQRKRHDDERRALTEQQREQRRNVLQGDWKRKGEVLNAMRSVVASDQAKAKAELRERQRREREALATRFPSWPDYEDWLAQHFSAEDAADYRYRSHDPQLIEGDGDDVPQPRDIRAFMAEVQAGAVVYRRAAEGGAGAGVSFVDRGRQIDVHEWRDQAAALAAMQLGVQKWGKVRITGNDDYKRMCVELAVEHGIQVSNPELQDMLAAERARRAKAREEARQAPQLTQFKQYHEAVGADRYRVTAIRLRENGTKSAFVLDKRGSSSVGFTTREIAWRMGEMQRLERRGENLYYTPLSAQRHHILIDDLSADKLQRLLGDGYKPAVVLESSPGNYQALLNVPKLGLPNEQDVANRLCRVLNERYGDPNLSGAIHPHRAPGFTNRKPERQRPDGSFPEVRLAYAQARECPKALTDAAVIARELDQMAQAAKAQASSPAYAAAPGGSQMTELYAAHRQDILARQAGGHIDLSRVDAMVAVRLRLTGHDQAEIAATLEACAPAVRPTTEGRNWRDYAQRTARYAFGPEGALTAARLERYRDQFLRLEGRDPAAELAHDGPRMGA